MMRVGLKLEKYEAWANDELRGQNLEGNDRLIRAGFVQMSQSGIYHILPYGVRVLDKIERIIDKQMRVLGASRLHLSSISTEKLWTSSGRLNKVMDELFRFEGRDQSCLLLSPTHEEEITTLVANSVTSYRDLPLRLYQTTRKYRDEIRPRQGLVRSKEFVMNDLYSFDLDEQAAIDTYDDVSAAYTAIFKQLQLLVVKSPASPGDMGGHFSHHFHMVDNSFDGDQVAWCPACEYVAAYDESFEGNHKPKARPPRPGSACPKCPAGRLKLTRGVEVGHTFYLGTRYSKPLGLKVPFQDNKSIMPYMGCYGIGPSRILGLAAVSSASHDAKNLMWPTCIAPFEVVLLPSTESPSEFMPSMLATYDALAAQGLDVVLDDNEKRFGWRIRAAQLVGIPVAVVFGNDFREKGTCEVICSLVDFKEQVPVAQLPTLVTRLVSRLSQTEFPRFESAKEGLRDHLHS